MKKTWRSSRNKTIQCCVIIIFVIFYYEVCFIIIFVIATPMSLNTISMSSFGARSRRHGGVQGIRQSNVVLLLSLLYFIMKYVLLLSLLSFTMKYVLLLSLLFFTIKYVTH
jgi:hypothetical protein